MGCQKIPKQGWHMDLISNAIEDSGSKEVQSLIFPDVRTVKGKNFTTKIL